jgi:hypothetical protein
MSHPEEKWARKYYKTLEGRTIKKTGVTRDGFPFFVLDDGTQCEISRDEEGNGPGFLFGLPIPK